MREYNAKAGPMDPLFLSLRRFDCGVARRDVFWLWKVVLDNPAPSSLLLFDPDNRADFALGSVAQSAPIGAHVMHESPELQVADAADSRTMIASLQALSDIRKRLDQGTPRTKEEIEEGLRIWSGQLRRRWHRE